MLPACVVIKTIIEIIKLLVITIMIITVIMIIISVYKALWKWCKVGNREMKYGMCKKNLKKKKNWNVKITRI